MKIVVAIDSFKNCMSSNDLGKIIKKAIKDLDENIEVICIPMSDGGENTMENLVANTKGSIKVIKSLDPLRRTIDSKIGFNKNKTVAYIDMASASGIELLESYEKNPCIASTHGTGILIKEALDSKVEEIIVGVGSSATNDLGLGMLQELGAKLYNENNEEIKKENFNILDICSFDSTTLDQRLKNIKITFATDVSNYLLGENGATYMFGKQKGADSKIQDLIETKFQKLNEYSKQKYDIDLNGISSGGAGGGIASSASAFLNAKIVSGLDLIINVTKIEEKIKTADLVITGEGYMDEQSAYGKVPVGIATLAKKYNVKTYALCGGAQVGVEKLYDLGIDAIFPIITAPQSLEEAIKNTKYNLYFTVQNTIKLLI